MNYEVYGKEYPSRSLSHETGRRPLWQRVLNIQRQLIAIVELSAWVNGEQSVLPDCTILADNLTRDALQQADLKAWAGMFASSLDSYKDVLTEDLSCLYESDVIGLENMIRQATHGIVVWIPLQPRD